MARLTCGRGRPVHPVPFDRFITGKDVAVFFLVFLVDRWKWPSMIHGGIVGSGLGGV